MIARINRLLELLSRIVSGASIMLMMAVAFIDSIGRPLSLPLPGGNEYVSFLLLVFFFSSLPLAVIGNGHIRVGFLADFYSGRMNRAERLVTAVLEVLALAVLAWMIFDQALRLQRFGTQSVYFEWPIAPFVYLACVFTCVALWFAIQSLGASRSGHLAPVPEKGE
jgi:TRAP-type C4-dicarboxylate transport system permease small subunit